MNSGKIPEKTGLDVAKSFMPAVLAAGKEIAANLFLSYGTVRNYVKLEAKNRIEAIGIAEKMGWLE
ncbi:hypothetical protein PSTEL_13780 [Paenibacillus stellifer]|uniref:Uncharacterized protein n=1 Tax=Paenibacillus stellifer TaxID=169760 RepID=A0A089LXN1_9BACL|nr:hypothetical protein PSTEL_13780 [Paenibacillus stellifer]